MMCSPSGNGTHVRTNKLDWSKVRDIRSRWIAPPAREMTVSERSEEIGVLFGVSKTTVKEVVYKKTWWPDKGKDS